MTSRLWRPVRVRGGRDFTSIPPEKSSLLSEMVKTMMENVKVKEEKRVTKATATRLSTTMITGDSVDVR